MSDATPDHVQMDVLPPGAISEEGVAQRHAHAHSHAQPHAASPRSSNGVGSAAVVHGQHAEEDDGQEESWGSRTNVGCCALLSNNIVGAFVSADPFQKPLRGRPTGRVVSENALCTLLLLLLMLAYGVVQAIRLRSAPPITVSETVRSFPVTAESLVVLFVIPLYNETSPSPFSLYYSCRITPESQQLMDQVPLLYSPETGESATRVSDCASKTHAPWTPFPSSQIAHGEAEFPLTRGRSIGIESQQTKLSFVSIRLFPRNTTLTSADFVTTLAVLMVHDEEVEDAMFEGESQRMNELLLEGDTREWLFKPNEIMRLQAQLEVVIDERKKRGRRVSKRVRWNVIDTISFDLRRDASIPPDPEGMDQYIQQINMYMSATYTRYTITQPDWVLPWLGSLGGAFTVLIAALSVLKMLLRPLAHSRAVRWLLGRCCCDPRSCLHSEVELVLKRKWVTTEAIVEARP